MRRSWLATSVSSTRRVSSGSSKPRQNSASASGMAVALTTSARANWAGADNVGRTWSGPTVQAASAMASAAMVGSFNLRMDGLQVAGAGIARGTTRHQLAQGDVEHGGKEQAEQGHAEHP